jgi:hypothetical protein
MNITYCKCEECGGSERITYPLPVDFSNVDTPWAVNCPHHGLVFLSNHGYNKQMNHSNHTWRCPMCGEEAWWDDENYEKYNETY